MSERIEKLLNQYRGASDLFAQAKASRGYLDEYRKSLIALLMRDAESKGVKTSSAQERDALAHPSYTDHLSALRTATEREETLRYHIKQIEMEIEVWRTEQANERFERKAYAA